MNSAIDMDTAVFSSPANKPASRMARSTSMLEMNAINDMIQFEKDMDELSGSKNKLPSGREDEEDDDSFFFLEMDNDPLEAARPSAMSPVCVSAGPPPSKEEGASTPTTGGGSTLRRSASAAAFPSLGGSISLASTLSLPTIHETTSKPQQPSPPPKKRTDDAKVNGLALRSRRSRNNLLETSGSSGSVTRRSSLMPKQSSLKSVDSSGSSRGSSRSLNLSVSFSSLEIRNYAVTMGDTPTTNGCPVQLDWEWDPEATEEYTVDSYENYRQFNEPRRSRHEMVVPASHRQYLLMMQAGFSRKEIKDHMEIVKKDALLRQKTQRNLMFAGVGFDEAIQKTKLKFGKLGRLVAK